VKRPLGVEVGSGYDTSTRGYSACNIFKDNLDRDATRVGSSTVKMTPGPTIVTPAKSTLYLRVTAYLI
jgi:hypothetical protein